MIRIVEVAPRDGLQNEGVQVPTGLKIDFVNALSRTGVDEVEVSSFVSPKWVPQLRDAGDLFAGIERWPGVMYSALVPNEQGLTRALAAHVDKIAVFTAASETFNQKNINTSIAGAIKRFAPVLRRSLDQRLAVRGYISTAFWCPYEGKIEPSQVVWVVRRLLDLGVQDISIGDTIGKATVAEVEALLDALLDSMDPSRIAMHFHDTYGNATANVLTAWRRGIECFDASAGGLGGCPYAPGAAGNVATETVVRTLREVGARVRVDLAAVAAARALLWPMLGRGAASVEVSHGS